MKVKAFFILIFLLFSREVLSYDFVPSEELQRKINHTFSTLRGSIVVAQYYLEVSPAPNQPKVKREAYSCGLLVSEDGLIMLPGHIYVGDSKPFNLTVSLDDGRSFDVEVLEKDKHINVTFGRLSIPQEEKVPYIEFPSELPPLSMGQPVLIFGISSEVLDHAKTFQIGIINAEVEKPRKLLSVDIPIKAGMNGALVTTLDGQPVGVIGYELSSDQGGEIYVRSGYPFIFTSDLFSHLISSPPLPSAPQEAISSWFGIAVQPLTSDLASYWGLDEAQGVLINTVLQDSPAEKAGLKRGDIIIEFNGQPIKATIEAEVLEFTQTIRQTIAGIPISIVVLRDKKPLTISAALGELPKGIAEAEKYINPSFGISLREITYDLRLMWNIDPSTKGVVVEEVEPASWSALAGVREGDIIQRVNNIPIEGIDAFKGILEEIALKQEKDVIFFVLRGQRTGFISIRPDWKED